MADVKITALPAVVTPATSDTFEVVQGGTSKQETAAQIRTAMMPIVLSTDVSGVLPIGRQAAQALAGDASGTTAAVVNDQARGLKSATTTVSVSAATAPTVGQVLTATSATTATWQTPGAGSGEVLGVFVQAMANANQTPSAGDVSTHHTIRTTGANLADRELILPDATDGTSYERTIENQCTGAFCVKVKMSSGEILFVENGTTQTFRVDTAGVHRTFHQGLRGFIQVDITGLSTRTLTAAEFAAGFIDIVGNTAGTACDVIFPTVSNNVDAVMRTVRVSGTGSTDVVTMKCVSGSSWAYEAGGNVHTLWVTPGGIRAAGA